MHTTFVDMITIISGTNRNGNHSIKLAHYVKQVFQGMTDEPIELLDLCILKGPLLVGGDYAQDDQSPQVRDLQDQFILPAEKFYFVVPEYNGSFPGILNFFLDACSVREYGRTFSGKKAAILGVSSGRAGNLRGMDHLTGILNYLNVTVMPNRLPVSSIKGLIMDDQIDDPATLQAIRQQVEDFHQF